jgi:hypothetical protein
MGNFNLETYATVEERLRTFWADPDNVDARIVTINHTTPADRSVSTWVVEARIYLTAGDQANDLPKVTGWAFEVDGGKGPQATSALEVCETSAIGRAAANYIYPGSKRPSREEMQKVERGVTPAAPKWDEEIAKITDVDEARKLYITAQKSKATKATLDAITAKVSSLNG